MAGLPWLLHRIETYYPISTVPFFSLPLSLSVSLYNSRYIYTCTYIYCTGPSVISIRSYSHFYSSIRPNRGYLSRFGYRGRVFSRDSRSVRETNQTLLVFGSSFTPICSYSNQHRKCYVFSLLAYCNILKFHQNSFRKFFHFNKQGSICQQIQTPRIAKRQN